MASSDRTSVPRLPIKGSPTKETRDKGKWNTPLTIQQSSAAATLPTSSPASIPTSQLKSPPKIHHNLENTRTLNPTPQLAATDTNESHEDPKIDSDPSPQPKTPVKPTRTIEADDSDDSDDFGGYDDYNEQ